MKSENASKAHVAHSSASHALQVTATNMTNGLNTCVHFLAVCASSCAGTFVRTCIHAPSSSIIRCFTAQRRSRRENEKSKKGVVLNLLDVLRDREVLFTFASFKFQLSSFQVLTGWMEVRN